jgi:soluble lytic murein transglycosylase
MMDRARYLRARNYDQAARDLTARQHNFTYQPADPERFFDMLLTLANDAARTGSGRTAYNIAMHLSDALPPGTDISQQPIGIRDNYTSLTWLAGSVAARPLESSLERGLGCTTPTRAAVTRCRCRPRGIIGPAERLAAGQLQQANAYFERSAAYPELFYGQLALERLGRSSPRRRYRPRKVRRLPLSVRPSPTTGSSRRSGFSSKAEARRSAHSLSERLLNRSTTTRIAALQVELGQQLGRQDLPVWVARMAAVKGTMFYC